MIRSASSIRANGRTRFPYMVSISNKTILQKQLPGRFPGGGVDFLVPHTASHQPAALWMAGNQYLSPRNLIVIWVDYTKILMAVSRKWCAVSRRYYTLYAFCNGIIIEPHFSNSPKCAIIMPGVK